MMDIRDSVSIEIKKLEISLKGKLQTLQPLSKNCCIYRVPPGKRKSDERLYTPQIVSIGPIHYGKEGLKAMEEHKRRYLQDFLGRTKVTMVDLLIYIKASESQLLECYAETIELGSDEFVEMILVDGAFITELLLRRNLMINSEDRIITKPRLITEIIPDMFLLENQLPMFFLGYLFELAEKKSHQLYMPKLIAKLWSWKFLLLDEKSIEKHLPESEHFVDLIRRCLQPPQLQLREFKTLAAPSATQLHQTGVQFKLARSNEHLLDIRFKNGILEIPKLTVVDETEGILRNLQIFEILHCETYYVNAYIVIMNCLVNTSNDVDLLMQNRVVENWLWSSEAVSSIFQNHVKGGRVEPLKFYYSGLIEDLNNYCKVPWHEWKAILNQNYFNTPWRTISVIAATILLILTALQTGYSIKI
ncbi:hypothetical protein Dsin_019209 [Dipteronia sinensis]|uniref:Uncharacterized protein n=1 Tax=Dipteronia sinensis TaxID=43782 RepID=A0AAE0A873_9ROSI|nr:hypothetical protein Dsin_019209 [Dipteronia sinensis]